MYRVVLRTTVVSHVVPSRYNQNGTNQSILDDIFDFSSSRGAETLFKRFPGRGDTFPGHLGPFETPRHHLGSYNQEKIHILP